jgi:hypothetical protein
MTTSSHTTRALPDHVADAEPREWNGARVLGWTLAVIVCLAFWTGVAIALIALR